MASICKSIEIAVAAPAIWDAARDVGNLHTRLVPGLVTDCCLNDDGGERMVTFANGIILPETMVTVCDKSMRVVWSARSPSWSHHNGALGIFAVDDKNSRISWTADVLPHEAADIIAPIMEAGLATMKAHLEKQAELLLSDSLA